MNKDNHNPITRARVWWSPNASRWLALLEHDNGERVVKTASNSPRRIGSVKDEILCVLKACGNLQGFSFTDGNRDVVMFGGCVNYAEWTPKPTKKESPEKDAESPGDAVRKCFVIDAHVGTPVFDVYQQDEPGGRKTTRQAMWVPCFAEAEKICEALESQ